MAFYCTRILYDNQGCQNQKGWLVKKGVEYLTFKFTKLNEPQNCFK